MRYFLILLVSQFASAAMLTSDLSERLQRSIADQLPKNARVQVDEASARVVIPASARFNILSPNPPVGLVSFEARWKEKGYPRKAFGSAKVRAYAPVLVARSVIRHGEALDNSNTIFESRELSPYLTTGYFQEGGHIPSLRSHGTLRAGVVIGAGNSQPAMLIQAGQAVNLVHRSGSLSITAKVKALEGGNPNSWVRVENPSSKKIFLAKVISPGEVRLR